MEAADIGRTSNENNQHPAVVIFIYKQNLVPFCRRMINLLITFFIRPLSIVSKRIFVSENEKV